MSNVSNIDIGAISILSCALDDDGSFDFERVDIVGAISIELCDGGIDFERVVLRVSSAGCVGGD